MQLAPGLTLELLPYEEAEACLDASTARGLDFRPTRHIFLVAVLVAVLAFLRGAAEE